MTVQITGIPNFGNMPPEQAKAILYDQVIPACEVQQVFLSHYGNHNSPSTLQNMEVYRTEKASLNLFPNIARIQEIFNKLDDMIQVTNRYSAGSYSLKHKIEQSFPGHHIWNGELIAAMILKGHPACFQTSEGLDVNCLFKTEFKE